MRLSPRFWTHQRVFREERRLFVGMLVAAIVAWALIAGFVSVAIRRLGGAEWFPEFFAVASGVIIYLAIVRVFDVVIARRRARERQLVAAARGAASSVEVLCEKTGLARDRVEHAVEAAAGSSRAT